MSYYIGIDGGGTKTEAMIVDEKMNILSRIILGATNPNDVGVEGSVQTLCRILEELLCFADTCNDVYVCAGIAGAGNRSEELLYGIKARFKDLNIKIVTDALLPIYSELGGADGASIISGTGSVCFAVKDGIIHRIGGWGYLIDGGGSGFNVGREVIESALRYYDKRGGSEYLYHRVSELCGAPIENSITEIYAGGKPYIASFAPLAFEGDAAGDTECQCIKERLLCSLGEYVSTAHKLIGAPFTVVLNGGIITSSQALFKALEEKCPPDVTLKIASARPVFGAIIGAMQCRDGSIQDRCDISKLRERFLGSCKELEAQTN